MTEIHMTKAIVKLPRKASSGLRHSQLLDADTNLSSHQAVDDFLVTDKLYINGLPGSVIESEIMDLVDSCKPIKIHLDRVHDFSSGYIQFSTKEMADRAYTLLNGATFQSGIKLQLKIYPSFSDISEPEAHAGILHIKNLPCNTNNRLYDLFRPFGPMSLCKILVEQGSTFKGTALVQYFHSKDAQYAQDVMNNNTVQDNVIYVFPFVSSGVKSFISTTSTTTTPEPNKSNTPSSNKNSSSTPGILAPLEQLLPPDAPVPIITSSMPQIRSDGSSMVDYTNLYIKNLDLNVESVDLFNNFRRFGHIISARVMKNAQTKQSKGFGFVSFTKADEAQQARQEMNNQYILTKPIIVAFHEPKKTRDIEVSPPNSTFHATYKQQQQQQHVSNSVSPVIVQNQQPTYTQSSSTQPTIVSSQTTLFEQQKQESYSKQQMQVYHYHQHTNNSTNDYHNSHSAKNNNRYVPDQRYNTRNFMSVSQKNNNSNVSQQQDRRQPSSSPENGPRNNHYQPMTKTISSSSGYHPRTTSDDLGIYEQKRQQQQQQQQQQIQFHSPKKAHEPPYQQNASLLNKNVSARGTVNQNSASLSSLACGAYIITPPVTTAINRPSSDIAISINNGYPHHHPQQQYAVSPPAQSQINNHLPYQDHRQQQQQQTQNKPTLRRRDSVESVVSVMTETSSQTRRHTITKAVISVEKGSIEDFNDIVDMLLTLKKKDLAICLFNKVFLKAKIKQAKDALNIFQEEEYHDHEDSVTAYNNSKSSSRRVSLPSPPTGGHYYEKDKTMAAKYVQNVMLAPKGSRAIPIVAPPPQPVPEVDDKCTNPALNDKELREEIDKFLGVMKGLELHQQKQMLGNKLFPLVKSTGVKHAPKITIRLLDSIPLEDLAYSMYDKDKLENQVSQVTSAISASY